MAVLSDKRRKDNGMMRLKAQAPNYVLITKNG